ncbi:MAG: class I SAM-dependent methyltransferase [Bacteroidota bacterium]
MPDNNCIPWFENWFDSPYYHILYKHRNYKEAELFIDHLIDFIQPETNAKFLDLGCGKGRHSVYLYKKGYDVTGVDLSPENIAYASQFVPKNVNPQDENLRFYVNDMRKIECKKEFDYVVNLFTSFGYFENDADDNATIMAVNKALKPEGTFVMDFMNAKKVIANLVLHEIKIIDDIEFEITKSIENNFIVKHIRFSDKGTQYNFQERVKALTLDDFRKYFAANKLKIVHLFGNYNLEKFDAETSNRLIIVAKKE